MNISELFTVDLHEKPQKLKLADLEGKDMGQHLMLIGVDSDSFADNAVQANRDVLALDEMEAPALEKIKGCYFLACTIKSWSFDDECTQENARNLMLKNKSVRKQVEVFADDLSNWAAKQKK